MKSFDYRFIYLKNGILSFLTGLVVVLMISCESKPPKNSFAAQITRGEVLFKEHCVACHGDDGTGLIIDSLTTQPANLTTLKLRNGGHEFPTKRVAIMIDGRQWVKAHGPRQMPIWGDVFSNAEDPGDKEFKGKLGELVAYLMSIQKKDEE